MWSAFVVPIARSAVLRARSGVWASAGEGGARRALCLFE